MPCSTDSVGSSRRDKGRGTEVRWKERWFEKVDSLLANYKCIDFCFYVRTYICNLQRKHLMTLLALTESWAASHDIPSRISLLVKDLK